MSEGPGYMDDMEMPHPLTVAGVARRWWLVSWLAEVPAMMAVLAAVFASFVWLASRDGAWPGWPAVVGLAVLVGLMVVSGKAKTEAEHHAVTASGLEPPAVMPPVPARWRIALTTLSGVFLMGAMTLAVHLSPGRYRTGEWIAAVCVVAYMTVGVAWAYLRQAFVYRKTSTLCRSRAAAAAVTLAFGAGFGTVHAHLLAAHSDATTGALWVTGFGLALVVLAFEFFQVGPAARQRPVLATTDGSQEGHDGA